MKKRRKSMEEYQIEKVTGEVFGDDHLIAIAERAEKRIDAVMKIKRVALKVTNANDWVDQNGRPYLMASGAEKIANLFNISWQIDEPTMEQEEDGTITYTYRGRFSLAGRSIEAEGSRSSRDEFFRKYIWEGGKKVGEKPLDRRDLKMAALTNLLGNGITRILGIRNLTYEDLLEYAGIKREDIRGIEYREKGKPPISQPKMAGKTNDSQEEKTPEGLSLREKLESALKELVGLIGGTESELIQGYSRFVDKKGEEHSVSNLDDLLRSEKWAEATLGRIRKVIEEIRE